MMGIIPTPREMPFLGDLALAAIGQGRVETTPLQIARLTSVIANGGYLVETTAGEIHTIQAGLADKLVHYIEKESIECVNGEQNTFYDAWHGGVWDGRVSL